MKIALAQISMTKSLDKNFQKSVKYLKQASKEGADLVTYPELQLSPFFPQYTDYDAEEYLLGLDSEYIQEFQAKCNEYDICACPNFYIQENGKNYDMSLFIDNNGRVLGKQKMVHIAQCSNFYEQSYYTPSDDGFHVIDTEYGKIAIIICFDRHYVESIRTAVLKGAELIIIPTANVSAEPTEMFEWEIRVQAFQNSTYIAMCNRVGVEDKMEFNGNSLIVDYNGEVVAKSGVKEDLIVSDIDLGDVLKERNNKPYTNLRRKEFYL